MLILKLVLDSHTHTLASGHAYSTLEENVRAAKEKGLELLCCTDHGVTMPGGPHLFYFSNLHVIQRKIDGVEILAGIEANIISYDGEIDIDEFHLKKMDIVLVSYHPPCIEPALVSDHTNGLIQVMKNPYVNVIAHSGNPKYPFHHDEVIAAAKEHNVIIEVNNSSLNPVSFREGSREICYKILEKCKQYGVPITIGSDAHISYDVGNFKWAVQLLEDMQFPEELILNCSTEQFKRYIEKK